MAMAFALLLQGLLPFAVVPAEAAFVLDAASICSAKGNTVPDGPVKVHCPLCQNTAVSPAMVPPGNFWEAVAPVPVRVAAIPTAWPESTPRPAAFRSRAPPVPV
ncbi:hypothetical protein CCC_04201 [Paramagnetospirillum magnetotacticum MS-1]|uniref:DUF2946 domain-containing protein n=2 Tax=Paramagnetospirillum magnetotacticum TaxID=188 RepID=A0A0C2YXK1_PARME|nr:hypothetical protein CCC_04201 [Paramagnetospirillum magnetotacticum MS-1]